MEKSISHTAVVSNHEWSKVLEQLFNRSIRDKTVLCSSLDRHILVQLDIYTSTDMMDTTILNDAVAIFNKIVCYLSPFTSGTEEQRT